MVDRADTGFGGDKKEFCDSEHVDGFGVGEPDEIEIFKPVVEVKAE